MITTILMDFDGVSFDLCEIHYEALNRAIQNIAGPRFLIQRPEHLEFYNGLPTKVKLKALTQVKGLDHNLHTKIHSEKQKLTLSVIKDTIKKNDKLIEIFDWIRGKGYKAGIVSNSVEDTVRTAIDLAGIAKYIDIYITNESCIYAKPNPAQYLLAMSRLGVLPERTLALEDSRIGMQSAVRAGCRLGFIENPSKLTLARVQEFIEVYS